MENAKKFFEVIIKSEEAKELLASIEAPESDEARIAIYIEIAKKLGVELNADEINEYFSSADETYEEIDDKELSQLVGGGENSGCSSTYKHKENCWWNDGCDRSTNSYSGYLCLDKSRGRTYADKERATIIGKSFHVCKMPSMNENLEKAGL